jgi:hypothetical protein
MAFYCISVLFLYANAAIVITEIHYHPLDFINEDGSVVSDDFGEFIEIKNTGTETVDLSGYHFSDGLTFEFAAGTTIEAGKFIVIAFDAAYFELRYGFPPNGVFQSGTLKNSGEKITLCDASGVVVDQVNFKDTSPWPEEADGAGNSLVPVDPNRAGDPNQASTWRASSKIHGSPGKDDPEASSSKVLVNEVLANTDSTQVDFVELYNPTDKEINISGWYLTDNASKPKKFKIPANTTIPAGGYLVFRADVYSAGENGFNFDAHGEEVFIFEADAQGNLTGYSHGYQFGEVSNNISFGRYTNSVGVTHFVPMATLTPGAANSKPYVGKVVLTEIMYKATDGVDFLELQNISNDTVKLYDKDEPNNTWRVGGISFNFPPNTVIYPGQIIVLIDDTISVDDFRQKYGMDSNIPVFPYTGGLQGNGETIKLEKPRPSYYDEDMNQVFPYMLMDWVTYGTSAPWPEDANGKGKSLNRIKKDEYGNDPANWKAEDPSPGTHNTAIFTGKKRTVKPDLKVTVNTNRLNKTFSISLVTSRSEEVSVELFDCQGRLHTRLLQQKLQPGLNTRTFSAEKMLNNNLLLLRVKSSGKLLFTEKLLLSK